MKPKTSTIADMRERPRRIGRRPSVGRERVVDAALLVFLRDGFAAARMDDIAREAGAAKGTLYLYFRSKEDMFEAVLRAHILPLLETAERIPEEGEGSAADWLRRLVSLVYENVVGTQLGSIMRVMVSEGERFPDLAAFYHDNIVARVLGLIRRILEYGLQRGEFRKVDPETMPLVIVGPAMAANLWSMMFAAQRPLDLRRTWEAHLDLVLEGLKVRD